jgi:hypothetical protein
MIEWSAKGEEWFQKRPTVAWVIKSDGTAEAIQTDSSGLSGRISDVGDECRIFHPDEKTG